MPIGVIRIIGKPAADDQTIDVLLQPSAGQFDGHWPKAESHASRLLWKNLTASLTPPRLAEIDPNNWFAQLREGQSEYLSYHGAGDRCLVYDLEVPFKMPIKVTGEGPTYGVSNTSPYTLHNLEFYKPTDSGWQTALLPELKSTQPHPATNPGASPTNPSDHHAPTTAEIRTVFVSPTSRPVRTPAALRRSAHPEERQVASSSATRPATRPAVASASTQPATNPSVSFILATAASTAMPVAAWKDRLAATGLAPIDTNLILSILQTQGPSGKRLIAIAQLSRDDLYRLIPEDVVPVPRKTVRVGLVIFRNIDPGIQKEVNHLIAQLGDDDWNKRQAASKALAGLGRAAQPQLEAATKSKDMEIVFRAEKLLHDLKQSSP